MPSPPDPAPPLSVECVYVIPPQHAANDGRQCVDMVVHDSGTTAHISNDKSVFIDGTLTPCLVNVYGVNGDVKTPLVARARGDIEYHLDDGFEISMILRKCLYVPAAEICGGGQAAVLVSTKLLARSGVGVHFLPGGDAVEFTNAGEVIGGFVSKGGLYKFFGGSSTLPQSARVMAGRHQ